MVQTTNNSRKNSIICQHKRFFSQNICTFELFVVILHPLFKKHCPLVYRYYTGFWFREARFDSSVDNQAAVAAYFFRKSGTSVMEYSVLSNTKTILFK